MHEVAERWDVLHPQPPVQRQLGKRWYLAAYKFGQALAAGEYDDVY